MKFSELNETIPYVKGGKEKILTYEPYPNIKLAMPGRHALDTTPVGGDFVVMVTDPVFNIADHQFTHTDLFKDVEEKKSEQVLQCYYLIVHGGADPNQVLGLFTETYPPGIELETFLYAVQCLAVAEHRRYAKYESKFGGRYLPFRFAAGISEGLWSAADAANLQRRGRPGVEMLEKQYGIPKLTMELMK